MSRLKLTTIALLLLATAQGYAEVGTASWYSVASTIKEGTGQGKGVMANGRILDDKKCTAAYWGVAFGTRLKVSRLDKKGKAVSSVEVVVTDRGPSRRLVRAGRIIDLSAAAFRELAPLSAGIIKVKVEVVK